MITNMFADMFDSWLSTDDIFCNTVAKIANYIVFSGKGHEQSKGKFEFKICTQMFL